MISGAPFDHQNANKLSFFQKIQIVFVWSIFIRKSQNNAWCSVYSIFIQICNLSVFDVRIYSDRVAIITYITIFGSEIKYHLLTRHLFYTFRIRKRQMKMLRKTTLKMVVKMIQNPSKSTNLCPIYAKISVPWLNNHLDLFKIQMIMK